MAHNKQTEGKKPTEQGPKEQRGQGSTAFGRWLAKGWADLKAWLLMGQDEAGQLLKAFPDSMGPVPGMAGRYSAAAGDVEGLQLGGTSALQAKAQQQQAQQESQAQKPKGQAMCFALPAVIPLLGSGLGDLARELVAAPLGSTALVLIVGVAHLVGIWAAPRLGKLIGRAIRGLGRGVPRLKEALVARPLVALGVVVGIAAAVAVRHYQQAPRYDPARVRQWERVTPRLAETDRACTEQVDRHLEPVRAFFAERRRNTRAFAAEVLSLGGKWAFVRSKLPLIGGEEHHRQFLRQEFDRLIFSPRDVALVLEAAVAGYLSDLGGQENQLLVRLYADLSDGDLAAAKALPALQTPEAFRREYERLVAAVLPVIARDLQVGLGQEIVSFVAGNIAADVAARIAAGVAARLGVSGGVLGAGAASGAATLGIGLVVGYLVDQALDWLLRQSGYDPEGKIAAQVDQTLETVCKELVEGVPGALERYRELRRQEQEAWFGWSADRHRGEAEQLEKSGSLGLRGELLRLHEARSRLRTEALKKLILEGGPSS